MAYSPSNNRYFISLTFLSWTGLHSYHQLQEKFFKFMWIYMYLLYLNSSEFRASFCIKGNVPELFSIRTTSKLKNRIPFWHFLMLNSYIIWVPSFNFWSMLLLYNLQIYTWEHRPYTILKASSGESSAADLMFCTFCWGW